MYERSFPCVLATCVVVCMSLGLAQLALAGASCEQRQKLLASDGESGDFYGWDLATAGDVVVIGAIHDRASGSDRGAAYVRRWDGSTWVEEQELHPRGGRAEDLFGISVSASGKRLIVGATWDDDTASHAGAAYVYRWNGLMWVEEQKLLASDGQEGDNFGRSVEIRGDVLVVGAWADDDKGDRAGAAYVFRWDGTAWVEEQKLLASDGTRESFFGWDVAVERDTVVVGAWADDENGQASGSAYVYRWNGTTWEETQKLLASDGEAHDQFGGEVFIEGDVLAVSAWSIRPDTEEGAVYIFRWNGLAWVEEQKLVASDGEADDAFGVNPKIMGDQLVVGSPGDDDNGSDSGSAYLFRWDGGAWVEEAKILAQDGEPGDRFGGAVAFGSEFVLVGSYGDDESGEDAGSVYALGCEGDNTPPSCDAGGGPDGYVVECSNGLGSVSLDGTGSSDVDGDPLTFLWSAVDCPGGQLGDNTSDSPLLELHGPPPCPLECSVDLEVSDGRDSTSCGATVTVEDTLAPEILEVGYDGMCAWSPNHKYVELPRLTSMVAAQDACADNLIYEVIQCESSQADDALGSGNTTDDCVIADDRQGVLLRAERMGPEGAGIEGREFRVTVRVSDPCSNSREAVGTVFVPHDYQERPDCLRAGGMRDVPR